MSTDNRAMLSVRIPNDAILLKLTDSGIHIIDSDRAIHTACCCSIKQICPEQFMVELQLLQLDGLSRVCVLACPAGVCVCCCRSVLSLNYVPVE